MENETYYYSQKKRVPLIKTDEFVAVDVGLLNENKAARKVSHFVEEFGEHLRRSHYLVRQDQLEDNVVEVLETASAAQPVFRSGEHLVVVLPEIRVHESRADKMLELKSWIGKHEKETEVVKIIGSRMTLRPRSNSGADALQLANLIHEEVGVEAAEPRMIQLLKHSLSNNSAIE